MTPNDERAQIRATGATSAHVGMTEAEQERARVVAWWRSQLDPVERQDDRMLGLIAAVEAGDHLKGVE